MLKLFVSLMCTLAMGYRLNCDQKTVLNDLKIPAYDFSVKLLDRVSQQTSGHFVFSPISTWLQLLELADGAQGETLNEILSVTQSQRICSRILLKEIFNSLDSKLSNTIKHRSIYVIDTLLDVKDSFVSNVETLNTAQVIITSFNNNKNGAAKVNEIVDFYTNGRITDVLDDNDFKKTVLLLTDVASMMVNWKSPFNPEFTKQEMFYSDEYTPKGYVNMMNQIGYFNVNDIPEMNTEALELPFSDKASMILLLPYAGRAEELFWAMKHTEMESIMKILRSNEPRLLNVKIPRFNITTDIDNIPELLWDMGLKKVFSPHSAELTSISDFRVYVSVMTNKYEVEVTEKGVSANIAPENIVVYEDTISITYNRPFVFLLVDNTADVILLAGVYTKPSLF